MIRVCTACGRQVDSPFCPYDLGPTEERPDPPRTPFQRRTPPPLPIEAAPVRRRHAFLFVAFFTPLFAGAAYALAPSGTTPFDFVLVSIIVVWPIVAAMQWYKNRRPRIRTAVHVFARITISTVLAVVSVAALTFASNRAPGAAAAVGALLGVLLGMSVFLLVEVVYLLVPPDLADCQKPAAKA